jgi:chromosome segregation ATPase
MFNWIKINNCKKNLIKINNKAAQLEYRLKKFKEETENAELLIAKLEHNNYKAEENIRKIRTERCISHISVDTPVLNVYKGGAKF